MNTVGIRKKKKKKEQVLAAHLKQKSKTSFPTGLERGQQSFNGFAGGIQSLYDRVQDLLTPVVPPCLKQSQPGHQQSENRIMQSTAEHPSHKTHKCATLYQEERRILKDVGIIFQIFR